MTDWLLVISHLFIPITLGLLAWVIGGSVRVLLAPADEVDQPARVSFSSATQVFLLTVQVASGLALVSWLAAILGLVGLFTLPTVVAVLLIIVVIGWLSGRGTVAPYQLAWLDSFTSAGSLWKKASCCEKALAGGVLLATGAISANAFIGALVPDMNQDAMWYHLSVPQQWTFSGRFDAYPNVMQSSFPLAAEALFAVILLFGGNAVMCSLLSVFCGFGFLVSLLSVTWISIKSYPGKMFTGWGIMSVLAVAVPLLSTYGLTAPVQAKNDVITMYWAFTGAMLLILPVLAARTGAAPGWWIVGGFLLGTACSAKPPVLSMTFFVLAYATAAAAWYEYQAVRRFPVKTLIKAGSSLAMIGLAALPWMIRGYLSHGVPLYPVGSSLFSIAPEFFPLNRSQTSIQGVPGLDPGEWLARIQQFPNRLAFGATNGEMYIFFYLLSGIFLLFVREVRWRWYGAMLLAQTVFLVGIEAAIEVFRLFSPVYALSAPAIGLLVASNANKIRTPVRYLIGLIIWVAVLGSVVNLQWRIANLSNRQWKFRPVLTEAAIADYATRVHNEVNYVSFKMLRPLIGEDERVLLLGTPFPFYLHRDALWNDDAIKEGGLADTWHKMNGGQAAALLQAEGIDVILYTSLPPNEKHPALPIKELLDNGVVKAVKIPEELAEKDWALYRVIESPNQ